MGLVQSFTWTFSVNGAGVVAFTASAAGTEGACGAPVATRSARGLLVPALSCSSAPGLIATAAGTGGFGFNGDGIAANGASLAYPAGVAVDGQGNAFVADLWNHRIRKIAAGTGVISTVAGTGAQGLDPDGTPAISSRLNQPWGVAVDGAGNVFIADQMNQRVCRVDGVTGLLTTVAGTGVPGYNADGIAASTAQLYDPAGVAVDGAGDVFIADLNNHRVRRVDAGTGLISTVAGDGTGGYNGDGIAATAAEVNGPTGVAVGAAGDLFVADQSNHRVRRVDAGTGVITTLAGTGSGGFGGDGGAATAAQLTFPASVAVNGHGDVLIADKGNQRVRRVAAGSGVIETLAGTGDSGYNGDGIAAPLAFLFDPAGVAFDAACRLYVADQQNNRIRRVDPGGG
ncbi:MAG: hypothetical protein AAB368_00220, partial [bacterium]